MAVAPYDEPEILDEHDVIRRVNPTQHVVPDVVLLRRRRPVVCRGYEAYLIGDHSRAARSGQATTDGHGGQVSCSSLGGEEGNTQARESGVRQFA